MSYTEHDDIDDRLALLLAAIEKAMIEPRTDEGLKVFEEAVNALGVRIVKGPCFVQDVHEHYRLVIPSFSGSVEMEIDMIFSNEPVDGLPPLPRGATPRN